MRAAIASYSNIKEQSNVIANEEFKQNSQSIDTKTLSVIQPLSAEEKKKKFPCKYCDFRAMTPVGLKKHLNKVHPYWIRYQIRLWIFEMLTLIWFWSIPSNMSIKSNIEINVFDWYSFYPSHLSFCIHIKLLVIQMHRKTWIFLRFSLTNDWCSSITKLSLEKSGEYGEFGYFHFFVIHVINNLGIEF